MILLLPKMKRALLIIKRSCLRKENSTRKEEKHELITRVERRCIWKGYE